MSRPPDTDRRRGTAAERPPLHDVDNGLRSLLRTGAPWHFVSQQTQRWLKVEVFEQMVHDVRSPLHDITDRTPQPRAVIMDSRTLPSTPECGGRAGDNGHNRRSDAPVHLAVARLGQLLAVTLTSVNERDRAQVAALAHSCRR